MSNQIYKIKVYSGKKGFDQLYSTWKSLVNNNFQLFNLPELYEGFLQNIPPPNKKFIFFLIQHNDKPCAIFPFLYHKLKIAEVNCKCLELPKHSHFNTSDFIIDKNYETIKVLNSFLRGLKNTNFEWDVIYLNGFTENSKAYEWSESINKRKFQLAGSYNGLLSTRDKNETLAHTKKRFQKKIKRLKKQLEQFEKVEYLSSSNGDDINLLYQKFLDVEASGWKGSNGTNTAIKLHDNLVRYYKSVIDTLAPLGLVEVNVLKINSITVAGQFCLKSDDKIYILKIGYNEEYKNLSPGHLMINYLVERYSGSSTIKFIDLYTDAEWINDWAFIPINIYNEYIFNNSAKGVLAYSFLQAGKAVRNLK